MTDGDKTEGQEGILAQGAQTLQLVKDECRRVDQFIWPAFPGEVDTVVIVSLMRFEALNAHLRSLGRLSADEDIGFMEDLKVTIIPLDTAYGVRAYTRPRDRRT